MSDFWIRKMKTHFRRIDVNNDGVLTHDDYKQMVDNYAKTGKVNDAQIKKMEEMMTAIFAMLTEGDTTKSVNIDQFITVLKKQIADPNFHQLSTAPMSLTFSTIDTNGDDGIDQEELRVFFQIFGIDKNMADETFKALDVNHDGVISHDEFIAAGYDFFTGEDESNPSQLFWGPLI